MTGCRSCVKKAQDEASVQQKVRDGYHGRHFLIFFLSPRVCSMNSSDAIDDRLPKLQPSKKRRMRLPPNRRCVTVVIS
jgi:hypothetical protein